MKPPDKTYMVERMLRSRYGAKLASISERLECSESTAKRIIADMRRYRPAPIVYNPKLRAYHYAEGSLELPGMQLFPEEWYALILMMRLNRIQFPGMLEEPLAPLEGILDKMSATKGLVAEAARRVRSVANPARQSPPCFDDLGAALLLRRRLSLHYLAVDTGNKSRHEVSPQHLLKYREKLYLDAWSHTTGKLETFELHWIEGARMLDTAAIDIPEHELDAHFTPAYGIHSGPATAIAILRFSPELARRIAGEILHPNQKVYWTETGHLIIEIPYGRPDELILDIMRYGPEVVVIGPPELREAVAERLCRAAQLYRREGDGKVG